MEHYNDIQPVASFKAPPEPPFQLSDGNHIVDFRYIAEVNALTIVLAGGDIILVNLEDHLLAGQEKVQNGFMAMQGCI